MPDSRYIRYDIPCGPTVFANIFTKGLAHIFQFCGACFYPFRKLQMNQKKNQNPQGLDLCFDKIKQKPYISKIKPK